MTSQRAQAAIVSLLFEDDFGLWEVRGECEQNRVSFDDMVSMAMELERLGVIRVYGRTPDGSEEMLPETFSLSNNDVWKWPGEASLFYWMGLTSLAYEWLISDS